MFVLDIWWSLIGGDVVAYRYGNRLPFRHNTTQEYEALDPLDESAEAHATHLLATYLRQFPAIIAFEFDGEELILKHGGDMSYDELHDLAAASLSYVIGCKVEVRLA